MAILGETPEQERERIGIRNEINRRSRKAGEWRDQFMDCHVKPEVRKRLDRILDNFLSKDAERNS